MMVKACVVETRGKGGEEGNIGSFNGEESIHLYSKEETPNCVNISHSTAVSDWPVNFNQSVSEANHAALNPLVQF
jgi:hypothetical protein